MKHLFKLLLTALLLLCCITTNATELTLSSIQNRTIIEDTYGISAMDPNCEGASIARQQRYVTSVTTKGAIRNLDYHADGPVEDGSQYADACEHIIEVSPGQEITMTIKCADFSDGLKWCYAGGWLDLNGSCDFDHPLPIERTENEINYGKTDVDPMGERVFFAGKIYAATPEFQNAGHTFTFKIPTHATACDSRLRIVFYDAWYLGEPLPTGLHYKGFTIDFGARITTEESQFTIDSLSYSINNYTNKTVTVTSNKKYTDTIIVPASVIYNGVSYNVTCIGGSAFRECTSLKSITIPNSVTSIGSGAFAGCSSLTSIIIPNSVTSIGDYAFDGCVGLTDIKIPNSLTSIGNYVFRGCTSLKSIIIPNSVTSIGDYAFDGCVGLTDIKIPNSLTSIGNFTFYNCSSLRNIINFSNLIFIKGGTGYGYIAYYAEKVINAPNGMIDDDFVFCTQNEKNILAVYLGNKKEIKLPENYKGGNYSIGDYAFSYCDSLTNITIPNCVTSISNCAFYDCI